jgi:hypothetical protein
MPYWINSTLLATPALLWMFIGVGLPWALVLLPREDWRDRPLVAALTLATGPALITLWMFILGSFTALTLLSTGAILAGSALIALAGWIWVLQKRGGIQNLSVVNPENPSPHSSPFLRWRGKGVGGIGVNPEEWLLIVLIVIALAVRWLNVAYWPHMAYDEMWVYGYEGRLYTLVGNIPTSIGYYPQFLPLQFSYLQIVTVGGIDDHVARAVLPYLQLGSILAVYALGSRLFNRRAGLFAAALWTFYPHVGEWSRFGDLEIPVTFLFTLASTFFLMAWTGEQRRGRYALLAGLTFGVAMWTKPTSGAFAWGVMLLTAFELVRLRFNWRVWMPRFRVAFITGLACIPIGGVWYLRNILLGHPALVFPEDFWLTQAARSGLEFSFPLLALCTLLLYLFFHVTPLTPIPQPLSPLHGENGAIRARILYLRHVLPALVLILLALVPSMIGRYQMGALDFALLLAGCAWLWWVLRSYYLNLTPMLTQHETKLIHRNLSISTLQFDNTEFITREIPRFGWMYLLGLPYFITWFYSYSYHYRLSFAIVPLMLMPTAVILARWLSVERVRGAVRKAAFAAAVIVGAYWGILVPLYDMNVGWMWTYNLPDDFARYTSGNWALMRIVYALQEYKDVYGVPLRISAPGVQRLAFFFPLDTVDILAAPTRLEDLRGWTHYVYSFEGERMYRGVDPLTNEVVSSRAARNVMLSSSSLADNDFLYELYAVNLAGRYYRPTLITPVCDPSDEVLMGGRIRFVGCYVQSRTLRADSPFQITFYWNAVTRLTEDYFVSIQLYDSRGALRAESIMPLARADDRYHYSTLFWSPAEYVPDTQTLTINADVPEGEGYQLVIGLVGEDGRRIPITLNGEPAGDSYTLGMTFRIRR